MEAIDYVLEHKNEVIHKHLHFSKKLILTWFPTDLNIPDILIE